MKRPVDVDPLLRPAEVAARFGVNVKSLARWRKTGLIVAVPLPSGHFRYRTSVVQAILDRGDEAGE